MPTSAHCKCYIFFLSYENVQFTIILQISSALIIINIVI